MATGGPPQSAVHAAAQGYRPVFSASSTPSGRHQARPRLVSIHSVSDRRPLHVQANPSGHRGPEAAPRLWSPSAEQRAEARRISEEVLGGWHVAQDAIRAGAGSFGFCARRAKSAAAPRNRDVVQPSLSSAPALGLAPPLGDRRGALELPLASAALLPPPGWPLQLRRAAARGGSLLSPPPSQLARWPMCRWLTSWPKAQHREGCR